MHTASTTVLNTEHAGSDNMMEVSISHTGDRGITGVDSDCNKLHNT